MSKQKLEVIKEGSTFTVELNHEFYITSKQVMRNLLMKQPDYKKTLARIGEFSPEINEEEGAIGILMYLISEMEDSAKEKNLMETVEVDIPTENP